ncbi:MAG: alpha-2-macroglobulin family protein [bacterium]
MEDNDNAIDDKKKNWFQTNAKWLSIIAVLVIIIIVGAIKMLASPPGRLAVKIESFEPTGEVPQTINFTIKFSQNMIDEELVGKQIENIPITFSPPITGKYKWIAPHILQFFPNVMLLPSTNYSAEILPKISAETGYYLKGNRKFKFHTKRFKVESANLSLRFGKLKEDQVPILGTIEFNYPVNLDDLKKNLTIAYRDGSDIQYQFINLQPGTIIQLESEKIEHHDKPQNIQLVINKELVPANGTTGLESNYIKNFELKPNADLKIEGVFPERQITTGYIKIRLSSPVDATIAKQYIIIEPIIDYQVTSNYHYVELKGNFAPKTEYSISIKEGLMAVDGSTLRKNFSTKVIMENIEPAISFVGGGIYLSRKGNLNLGLSTINVQKVQIEVRKIFANNLIPLISSGAMDYDYYWYNLENLGKVIYNTEISIPQQNNEEIITPINMEPYLKDEYTGIFDVIATSSDEQWRSSHKLVMITDLGITVKRADEQFLVWVHSLSDVKPIGGANVTLISQNNQIMKRVSTDRSGLAKFEVEKNIMDNFNPYLITVAKDKDLSFIELTRSQITTTDFDVEGFPYLQDGFDAFVYGERNIYRPGEKAHLVTIIRGPKAELPPQLPIKLEILGPDNRIFNEFKKVINNKGASEFEIDIPSYARTGYYTARVIVGKDDEIGRGGFSVEEFMPDRIKVSVNTDSDSYKLGQTVKINISAINLFGPPASGRRVDIQAQIESDQYSSPQWKTFVFNNDNKTFSSIINNLGRFKLDENGKYITDYNLPVDIYPPSSLKGIISATVHESGGRTVTGYKTVAIHPYTHYVGLRQVKEDYAEINKPKEFEFVVLDQNGQIAVGKQCEVLCYRITWQSILKRSDGRVNYVSERQENLDKSFIVTSGQGAVKFQFIPDQYDEYRIEIKLVENGHSSAMRFYVSGWGYAPWAMNRPERLDIGLDKKLYKPGESAKVQIRSPFSGRLLVTIDGDKIYHTQSIDMGKKNTATISIKIQEEYKPNVYITASVIRPTMSLEKNAPVRAYGVVPLFVDSSKNKLSIVLDAPDEIRPNNSVKIGFSVTGRNKEGYITIAAVDEGICQLTNFQTPDPLGYFFGKKRLEVSAHDIYASILPEIEKAITSSTTSGGEPGELRMRISPVSVARVKPVALWSGLVKVGKDGKGNVTFNVPQFNGSLRIMAVSFSNDEFGSASKNLIIREPIVLTPTFPRFIASGDKIQAPVSIYNGMDKTERFTVTLNVSGPVEKPSPTSQSITLQPKTEAQLIFSIKALMSMGKATFTLSATDGTEKAVVVTDVPVRPASPPITLTGTGTVKAGNSAKFYLPGNWIPGTTKFDLTISSFPAMQFAGSLQYLLQYPHGCAEQTVSRLFPLLYFNDMAKVIEPELFGVKSADYYIEEGITKLESMQTNSGDFEFWPAMGRSNPWASVYVSHFFVEARKAGYGVSERVYRNMIKAMQNHAKAPIKDDWQLEVKVYACYVLAMAGEPEKSTMIYLKNSELDRMSDYSQYQLAGAFAFIGDLNTARSLIPSTVQSREIKRESGGNFNSSIRAQAIMLSVLAEFDPDHPSVPKLIESLAKSASQNNRWYTTQENAFAFLALGKILKKQPPGKYTGTVSVNNTNIGNFSSGDYYFTGKDWGGKEINITVQGTGTCYYYWKAFGIPAERDIKEFDQELIVRRKHLNGDGKPVDYNNFQQGDLLVTEITIKSTAESLDNVVIVDLLPTGLEIENPRLGSRAGIPWIKAESSPDYMDIRDDRMIIFASIPRQKEVKFYYAVRVVTVGEFVLPSTTAEAMYDPAKISISSSGKVKVMPY